MSKAILYPYKMGSKGSKVLKAALVESGTNCLKVFSNRRYNPLAGHIIINWGNSTVPNWEQARVARGITLLNNYNSVAVAKDKLRTFQALFDTEVTIPLFTTDSNVARSWFDTQQVSKVFCRTLLNSSSGKGIVVANNAEEVVSAPLYTEGLPIARIEYRVHIVGDTVIDISQKKKKAASRLEEGEVVDMDIRSHEKGWIYCRDDIRTPEVVMQVAKQALRELSLDFGAVDICIIKDERDGSTIGTFIFEVNTAPGLEEGSTATRRYVEHFAALVDPSRDVAPPAVEPPEPTSGRVSPPTAPLRRAAPIPSIPPTHPYQLARELGDIVFNLGDDADE